MLSGLCLHQPESEGQIAGEQEGMVEGALDGESRALGSSPNTDFLQQIHEPGGLGLGGLMPFPALK